MLLSRAHKENHKEASGGNRYVYYLDCGDAFHRNTCVQMHQIARFKYVLFLYIYTVVLKKERKENASQVQEREGCQVWERVGAQEKGDITYQSSFECRTGVLMPQCRGPGRRSQLHSLPSPWPALRHSGRPQLPHKPVTCVWLVTLSPPPLEWSRLIPDRSGAANTQLLPLSSDPFPSRCQSPTSPERGRDGFPIKTYTILV